jgi:hypothetical protein
MRIPIRQLRAIHRMNRAGPVALLAVLGLLGWALAPTAPAPERFADVALAFRAVPFAVGGWYGVDVPLPAAANELLRPTAVLSRRYQQLGGGRSAILGLVHCADLRDMLGHHPPRCYPASGWQLAPDGSGVIEVRLGERRTPARMFRFDRTDRSGLREELTVLGIFLLPDGSTATEEATVSGRAGSRVLSSDGLAQLQIVVEGWATPAEMVDIADSLLVAIPRELLEALGQDAPVASGLGPATGSGGDEP